MAEETGRPTGPLAGIRVVDLTSVVLGPIATQVLADFGADVVKVETPEGDRMRANGVSVQPGMSSIFLSLNRNKRSMQLDLKQPHDREAMRRLLAGADVLVHNMRVQAVERLGFGYEAVRAINPRIVYCVGTGFGQDGPHRDKPAFDDIIQAACGLVAVNSSGRDEPDYVPSLFADKVSGWALAQAVLAALVHRGRGGEGQYVEVPMLETMAGFVLAEHMGGIAFPGSEQPWGYHRLLGGGRKPARTRDGWVAILPYTSRHWQDFFTAVGRPELIEQLGVTDRAQRNRKVNEIYRQMRELLVQRTTAEWLQLCEQHDIPATPIYAVPDLPRHPHLEAVRLFQRREHPTAGPVTEVRPAARFARTPVGLHRHAPTLGEHTDEILAELGLPPREA